MDVHGETGSVELGDEAREALRIEIKLAGMLGGFAVLIEIGRQQRRRLRRIFITPSANTLTTPARRKSGSTSPSLLTFTRRATASSLSLLAGLSKALGSAR
jgi:hypothetical protein